MMDANHKTFFLSKQTRTRQRSMIPYGTRGIQTLPASMQKDHGFFNTIVVITFICPEIF